MTNEHLEKLHEILTILDNGMYAYRNILDREDCMEAMRKALYDGAHLVYQLHEVERVKKEVQKRRVMEDNWSW